MVSGLRKWDFMWLCDELWTLNDKEQSASSGTGRTGSVTQLRALFMGNMAGVIYGFFLEVQSLALEQSATDFQQT